MEFTQSCPETGGGSYAPEGCAPAATAGAPEKLNKKDNYTPSASEDEVLGRFFERLPRRPYCTDDLSLGIRPLPSGRASRSAYIQTNRPNTFAYLWLDVDRSEAGASWLDADLPQPTLIIQNEANGHAHLAYELSVPVYDRDRGNKPFRYIQALNLAYTERLGADKGFVGFIAKNPLSRRWRTLTCDVSYELGELAEYVDLTDLPRRSANDDSALGRNCSLFNAIRKQAYQWVHDCVSHDQLSILVLNAARNYNAERFSEPLRDAEVQCIARSIARWTWKYQGVYNLGGTSKRRILELDRSLPLDERQRLGVEYVHAKRRSETEARIINAISILLAQGKRATKSGVAKVTGINRVTISRRYSHLFVEG